MRRICKGIGIVLLSWFATTEVFADQPAPRASRPLLRLCYCGCEAREKKPECTKMCDLPKYKKREWATSCHKRPQPRPRKSPESRPHPPKRNQIETAGR